MFRQSEDDSSRSEDNSESLLPLLRTSFLASTVSLQRVLVNERFLRGIENLHSLQLLELDTAGITDKSLPSLCFALRKLTCLSSISLARNHISSLGFSMLLPALGKNPLLNLDLDGNIGCVSEKSCYEIAQGLI